VPLEKLLKGESVITPDQCTTLLPEIPLSASERDADDTLRQAELRQSVLLIAGVNHLSETELVRAVVENALGKLPEMDE
jgi:hypothetical protein